MLMQSDSLLARHLVELVWMRAIKVENICNFRLLFVGRCCLNLLERARRVVALVFWSWLSLTMTLTLSLSLSLLPVLPFIWALLFVVLLTLVISVEPAR